MITTRAVEAFLSQPSIAVVGPSDDKASFGGAVYRALRARGQHVVPVNPHAATVDGDTCYPDLLSLPEPVAAVLVMVPAVAAASVVQDAVGSGVRHIWLFKGIGSPGAVSQEAIQIALDHSVNLVAGACPLMFLEPVGLGHRVHRGARRLNGSLVASTR